MVILSSCDKEGGDGKNAKVTFRKANIAGAQMLALAQGGAATKAEGDVTVGPRALYTVSEDGSMVEVSYTVDVEGADGNVAETIQANLIISPGFVFPVDEGWLWLANCHYDVKGGWNNYPKDGNARHALSKIINDFSAKYHDRHGAHYLIRKSDGALFEWTLEAGAPNGMDDGFKQPSFLNGWFHQLGKDLFVRTGGWNYDGINGGLPSLICLKDNGNTLDAVNVLGDNISCWKLYPAGGSCLGGTFGYPGANGGMQGIIAPPSFEPVLLQVEASKESFLLSIGGKLYYADTGILIANLDDEAQEDLRAHKNLGVYKGALYENFVAEGLIKEGYNLYYYQKDNSTLEMDFFIRSKDYLIPVEVKSSENNKSDSLLEYLKLFKPDYSIRISEKTSDLIVESKQFPCTQHFA